MLYQGSGSNENIARNYANVNFITIKKWFIVVGYIICLKITIIRVETMNGWLKLWESNSCHQRRAEKTPTTRLCDAAEQMQCVYNIHILRPVKLAFHFLCELCLFTREHTQYCRVIHCYIDIRSVGSGNNNQNSVYTPCFE